MHIEVAHGAQALSQPPQLFSKLRRRRAREGLAEQPQDGAQPADTHPHVVQTLRVDPQPGPGQMPEHAMEMPGQRPRGGLSHRIPRADAQRRSLGRNRHDQPGPPQPVLEFRLVCRLQLQLAPQPGGEVDQRRGGSFPQLDLDSSKSVVAIRSGDARAVGRDLKARTVPCPNVEDATFLIQLEQTMDVEAWRQREEPGPQVTTR